MSPGQGELHAALPTVDRLFLRVQPVSTPSQREIEKVTLTGLPGAPVPSSTRPHRLGLPDPKARPPLYIHWEGREEDMKAPTVELMVELTVELTVKLVAGPMVELTAGLMDLPVREGVLMRHQRPTGSRADPGAP
jgi:hypothetical protein